MGTAHHLPQPTHGNPKIILPDLSRERSLSQAEWKASNFPTQPLPASVTGVVNVQVWKDKITELLNIDDINQGLVDIMTDISNQLSHGANSYVESPGTDLTHGSNMLHENSEQIPRVVDTLATFVKARHIAGPLHDEDSAAFKVNPLMAMHKPGGDIRVVGNLKYPSGSSFNDGINEDRLRDWPVKMLTAAKFAKMVVLAGRNAFMACSDMQSAYKMIPICKKQRKLQAYTFCGALFIELKLIFGDRLGRSCFLKKLSTVHTIVSACSFFDKFHFAILRAFVLPMSSFPTIAQGMTVDDIPSVVPQAAQPALAKFVSTYRKVLSQLNIKAANDDPSRTKAFDCSTEGEVLGVRFNTVSFTWSLPKDKLHSLVTSLREIAEDGTRYSLRELESILGKLNNIAQLCPALKTFTSEATFSMREHIKLISNEQGNIQDSSRDSNIFRHSPGVSQDLLMVAAIMADTHDNPLPIIDPDPPVPLCSVQIYPDASGHIAGPTSPSLGIFFPPHDLNHAAAYSLPFPTDFLLHSNGSGLVADTTSTLEALGVLVPLVINPHRCVGKTLHYQVDNIAVVFAFNKRRSNDKLAHTIIRASYLVAGALACKIFVSWRPRRSDEGSIIADDLTHIDFSTALSLDQFSYTRTLSFPPSISDWMKEPAYDRDLGHHILSWMSSYYDNLL